MFTSTNSWGAKLTIEHGEKQDLGRVLFFYIWTFSPIFADKGQNHERLHVRLLYADKVIMLK